MIQERELRERMMHDPQFHMLVQMVYRSIGNGETSIQDWRDAVNLAYTEWHARHVGRIEWHPGLVSNQESSRDDG